MYYAMRTDTFAKIFFLISITGLIMYAVLAFCTFHTAYTTITDVETDKKFAGRLKYILIWSQPELPLLTDFGNGQEAFEKHECDYKNCFITTNKDYLSGDYTNFHAVIFDINVLGNWRNHLLPKARHPRQKYIFYSTVASDVAPICNIRADNYFNWTWSFKRYSDIVTPFIEVRNLAGEIVAPYNDVTWDPNLENTVYDDDSSFMKNKTKAVAWIINKCITRTPRRIFAKELQKSLLEYNLVMDVYGCRNLDCPKEGCLKAIERDYFFYLAYEDSIEIDYVTDEVLKAYHHNAVPIVIGGADYSQFLPPGSYINARFMTAEMLAAFINFAYNNPEIYLKFFSWKKFYTINKTEQQHGVCELCNLLNYHERFTSRSSYHMFRGWWYTGPLADRCFPKGTADKKDWLSYANNSHKQNTKL